MAIFSDWRLEADVDATELQAFPAQQVFAMVGVQTVEAADAEVAADPPLPAVSRFGNLCGEAGVEGAIDQHQPDLFTEVGGEAGQRDAPQLDLGIDLGGGR